MSRTVSFYVREHPEAQRHAPEALYFEPLGCYLLPATITLTDDEFRFVSRLASRAISAAPGSQERREGFNEVITLVEIKDEFPEAEFQFEPDEHYRPAQDSLFQIPDEVLRKIGGQQQPLPEPRVVESTPTARNTDPGTSHAAAEAVRFNAQTAKGKLLRAHYETDREDLTDEEAAKLAGLSLTSEYATRCSELRNLGLLVETGDERRGRAGMARIASRITQHGIDYVEEHGWLP